MLLPEINCCAYCTTLLFQATKVNRLLSKTAPLLDTRNNLFSATTSKGAGKMDEGFSQKTK
jgi:hypothetical protein